MVGPGDVARDDPVAETARLSRGERRQSWVLRKKNDWEVVRREVLFDPEEGWVASLPIADTGATSGDYQDCQDGSDSEECCLPGLKNLAQAAGRTAAD